MSLTPRGGLFILAAVAFAVHPLVAGVLFIVAVFLPRSWG